MAESEPDLRLVIEFPCIGTQSEHAARLMAMLAFVKAHGGLVTHVDTNAVAGKDGAA